jgi:hypothetical protein
MDRGTLELLAEVLVEFEELLAKKMGRVEADCASSYQSDVLDDPLVEMRNPLDSHYFSEYRDISEYLSLIRGCGRLATELLGEFKKGESRHIRAGNRTVHVRNRDINLATVYMSLGWRLAESLDSLAEAKQDLEDHGPENLDDIDEEWDEKWGKVDFASKEVDTLKGLIALSWDSASEQLKNIIKSRANGRLCRFCYARVGRYNEECKACHEAICACGTCGCSLVGVEAHPDFRAAASRAREISVKFKTRASVRRGSDNWQVFVPPLIRLKLRQDDDEDWGEEFDLELEGESGGTDSDEDSSERTMLLREFDGNAESWEKSRDEGWYYDDL